MKEYFYRFEKSPKRKGTCPQCKEKNKFRYYEDTQGNRLDESFGKCERINGCGYYNPPSANTQSTKNIVQQTSNNQIPIKNPTGKILEKLKNTQGKLTSNFHIFCRTLGITDEHFIKYGVGTDDSAKTVFVLKNCQGEIVNAKWFVYTDNGKRDKSYNSHSLVQPKDGKFKFGICLYGEHLLDPSQKKTVVIVESEKTMVIASFFYPAYDWIACGSNNGLSAEKIGILKHRKVIWLCDADTAGRKNSSIKNLKDFNIDYQIVDLFPQLTNGYDIADAIIEGKLPELEPKQTALEVVPSEKKSEALLSSPSVTYKHDYSIWVKTKNQWEVVANNFLIFIKYQTIDEQELCSWILEIKIKNKEVIYMEVPHDDFCSAKRMKNVLAAKLLSFKANDVQLGEIHDILYNRTQFTIATKVNRYGFHKESDTYLFANKVLLPSGELVKPDDFGVVPSPKLSLSLPQSNKKMKERFTLTDFDISFNEWFELYAKVHSFDKAFVPSCFYIMSLFRDVVIGHKNSSPILYLKGGAGTGKTSIVRSLTCLFGFKQGDINLKSKNTEAALVKLMGQSANTMLWMDEYHNDFAYTGLLQAAYDNSGYHKTPEAAKNNNETDSVDIYCALALTSNYIPKDSIFFSRCILIQVESNEKTEEQRTNFHELRKLEENGLGLISVELLRHRNLIIDEFASAYTKLFQKIEAKIAQDKAPERLLNNITQALTCAYILHNNGKIAICESTEESDVLDEFAELALKCIKAQYLIQEEASVLSQFFNVLQYMYDTYAIKEGVHFRIEGDFLLLRMPSIYPIFKIDYRKMYSSDSPDRDSIIEELVKLEAPRHSSEIIKTIRFKKDKNEHESALKNSVTNSLSLTYKKYISLFGLDLNARTLER